MGAAVAIVALTSPGAPRVDGVILSAPAVWGGAAMSPFYRGVLWVMRRVVPSLTLTGRGLGKLASDNIPMLQALASDPLFIKATRVDAIGGLVDLMGEARERGPDLRLPTLILQGAHDEIVPPDAQLAFAASIPEDRCILASYPDGWHMLLRDLQRQRVWADILAWIDERPLPSGAGRPCAAAVATLDPVEAG
jgi:alpha-beta hydrolase superfamily lysophospholipase